MERGLALGLSMAELSAARDALAALRWAARARSLLAQAAPDSPAALAPSPHPGSSLNPAPVPAQEQQPGRAAAQAGPAPSSGAEQAATGAPESNAAAAAMVGSGGDAALADAEAPDQADAQPMEVDAAEPAAGGLGSPEKPDVASQGAAAVTPSAHAGMPVFTKVSPMQPEQARQVSLVCAGCCCSAVCFMDHGPSLLASQLEMAFTPKALCTTGL